MKYCPNCGRELADEMKFCGGCGTPQMIGEQVAETTKKKKSNGKGLLVLPVLVVGAVVCLALFFGNKDGKDDGNNRASSISTGEVEESEILDESDKDEMAEKDTEIIWMYVEHFYDLGPMTLYLGSEQIEDSLIEKYEHDSEGYIKKVFQYDSNDELVYTNDYIWGENRNNLKCISYNSKNEVDGTTEWNYENGNLKSFKDWDSDGNLTWEIQFNEYGDRLNEMKYEGEVIERYEYVYDEDAKLISKFGYEDESLVEKYEYFYDEKGNQVKEEEWNLSENSDFFLFRETQYTYDKNGSMISEAEVRMRNSGEVFFCDRTEYSYDSDGNVVEERNYNKDDQIEELKKYTYDEHGNKLSVVWFDSNGNEYAREEWVWKAFERRITN